MSIPLRVLIVEDSKEDAELLLGELRRGGFEPVFERVETSEGMILALNKQTWDVVFSDYTMPHFSGADALVCLKERNLDVPFIFVSGTIGEEAAVRAMKAGAQDYIMKGSLNRLVPVVKKELHEMAVRRERKRVEERIHHLAYHDVLTDLPNRTLFYDRLQQAILIGHRERRPLALLLLDLDRFKEVNDTFGHHYGDLLLRQIGLRLRKCLRESDTIARVGGDEFAVMLPNTHLEGASLITRKILKALETPFALNDATVEVGGSIGIALYPDHGEEGDLLFQQADKAMYAAKQAGGGYRIYLPKHEQSNSCRRMLMGKLSRAIEQEELEVYYQPQWSLKTNRVIGVEALSRWLDPQLGWISPDRFVSLAEQTGLIKPFTQWILKTVCRQYDEWEKAGLNVPVSVNLSARNLLEKRLPDQVAALIRTGCVQPALLEFEITERMMMGDPPLSMEVLTRLHAMGFPLVIDDFGTGYSSLSYLKKLPVQKIKIDKSFIVDLENKGDIVIVHSMINMGHSLGLKVVAEGVEDEFTKNLLDAFGCDVIQGYYISHPLPFGEMTRWLKDAPPEI